MLNIHKLPVERRRYLKKVGIATIELRSIACIASNLGNCEMEEALSRVNFLYQSAVCNPVGLPKSLHKRNGTTHHKR